MFTHSGSTRAVGHVTILRIDNPAGGAACRSQLRESMTEHSMFKTKEGSDMCSMF